MLANSFQNTGNWTTNPKKTSENVDVRTFLTTSFCKNKERYARFILSFQLEEFIKGYPKSCRTDINISSSHIKVYLKLKR